MNFNTGSFKGDIDTGIDVDVDLDITRYRCMTLSTNWVSFKKVQGSC